MLGRAARGLPARLPGSAPGLPWTAEGQTAGKAEPARVFDTASCRELHPTAQWCAKRAHCARGRVDSSEAGQMGLEEVFVELVGGMQP